jgi:stage V sporulation protein G
VSRDRVKRSAEYGALEQRRAHNNIIVSPHHFGRRTSVEITEVRITLRDEEKLKAFANVTFDDAFVVRGLKVINGNNGYFVSMPSRKRPDGTYQDIAHPINNEMRDKLERSVLSEYEKTLKEESSLQSLSEPAPSSEAPEKEPEETPEETTDEDYEGGEEEEPQE